MDQPPTMAGGIFTAQTPVADYVYVWEERPFPTRMEKLKPRLPHQEGAKCNLSLLLTEEGGCSEAKSNRCPLQSVCGVHESVSERLVH